MTPSSLEQPAAPGDNRYPRLRHGGGLDTKGKMSLSPQVKTQLANISTATLATQLAKRGFRNTCMRGVRQLSRSRKLVGAAFTLRYIPAREDLDTIESLGSPEHPQRKAIESIPADHVLVMDCRGEQDVAGIGSILVARLKVRGVAGVVCDGGIRDLEEAIESELPLFAAGAAAPANIIRHHAVDLDVPIACGGVSVFPGDIMVGDADGIVVVPAHLVEEIVAAGFEQEQTEAFILDEIRSGAPLFGTYPPNEETMARYRSQKR